MSVDETPKRNSKMLVRRKTITQEKKISEDEFMASAIGDVEWLKQSLRGREKGTNNFDKNVCQFANTFFR